MECLEDTVLYRWWKLIPEKAVVARHLATFVNGLYAVVVLNLTSIAFMVCKLSFSLLLFFPCHVLLFLVCVILSQISSPNLVGLDNTFFVHWVLVGFLSLRLLTFVANMVKIQLEVAWALYTYRSNLKFYSNHWFVIATWQPSTKSCNNQSTNYYFWLVF